MGLFDKITGGAKKREAFYAEYAESHGLERSKAPIPRMTRNSEDFATNERFDGELAPGLNGTVALVEVTIAVTSQVVNDELYNETWSTADGSSRTETREKAYPSTVVLIPVPHLAGTLSGLALKKNFNKQMMPKDNTYGELQRVSIEGLGLDDNYYLYADANADQVGVRALFTPEFSTWLNARDEKFFSFEIGEGTLVRKRPKHADDAEDLDGIVSETCEIASQLGAA